MAMPAHTETLGDYALAYAQRGLEIFPADPADKAPLCGNGLYDATTDPDTIVTWWRRWPNALIACRVPDDTVILDIDPRHGGHDTWAALCDAYGHTQPTRWHASGRGDGGQHHWWQHPGGKLNVRKINDFARSAGVGHPAGKRGWTGGIDLLHHGHRYTILPPSPHPDTGQPYTWGPKTKPGRMPGWLAALLTADQPAAPEPNLRVVKDADSIADWFTANTTWREILHGWHLVDGDGDSDGSAWRHPNATAAQSATIRHGCLFVYTPNTDFEPTEAGDPHGYTRFRAWALLEHDGNLTAAAAAAYELRDGPREPAERINPDDLIGDSIHHAAQQAAVEHAQRQTDGLLGQLITWPDFWAKDHKAEEWIAWPLIPRGRQVALYAPAKTGKSIITLAAVAAAATGRPIFGNPPTQPIDVLYLDYEMTDADLHERLEALGYGPDVDMTRLHYALLPSLPPLNTQAGCDAVCRLAELVAAEVVVVDTTGRAVEGEENNADTYKEFARLTGLRLKAAGRSVLRTDHAGKDKDKGQRGSSAKNDDVDVVLRLDAAEDGYVLTRTHSRVAWVPEKVAIDRSEDADGMVTFTAKRTARMYAPGTKELAAELDRLGVPVDTNRAAATAAYKAAHGKGKRGKLIDDAIAYRRSAVSVDDLL